MMKDRDCEHCRHYVYDSESELYSCESWDCEFEPEEEQDEQTESE